MSMLDSLMDGDIPTIPAQADLPTDPEGALIVIDGLVELAGPVARERERQREQGSSMILEGPERLYGRSQQVQQRGRTDNRGEKFSRIL